jgi:dTMP kinase
VGARRGPLIVFEGPEGVGKTTQVRWLADHLAALGLPHVALREPGGTALGERVRGLVLDAALDVHPRAEALLFLAARAQLLDAVREHLDRGAIVLLDRFFLSTYAYQVAGRGLPEDAIREANAFATGGLTPDLTILLSYPADAGLARVDRRGERDRMERAGADFHARVAAAFDRFREAGWQAVHPETGPIAAVDAGGSESEVAERVARALAVRWPETFPLTGGSE